MNGVDAVHGFEALGDSAAPEVVVEMESPLVVQHLGHGLVGKVLERLNVTEVL